MNDNFNERLRKSIQLSTFCYAKEDGQGFVEKKLCACGNNKCCQEYLDQERFHQRFKELGDCKEIDPDAKYTRSEIIEIIKSEFQDSKWYRSNVNE